MSEGITLCVESIIGYKTGLPIVQLTVGSEKTQMDVAKAREIAFNLLKAAEAAEVDLFLFRFMQDKVGTNAPEAACVLEEFRTFREGRSDPERN